MTTRASLITEKYEILTTELKTFFDAELFPSLDSIDVADLVYFVTLTFLGIEKTEDFEEKIMDLITCHGFKVTDKQMVKVVPLISNFVLFLRNL
jgi:hypothetical protein